MADDQVIEQIQAILLQYQPYIKNHGGLIEFVEYKQNIVYVRLHGACIGCPASLFTLKLGLEEALKTAIPSILEVISVN
jgi:Fe-S cluster biogenesis protein NfuA